MKLELPELPALSLTGNGQQLRETVFADSSAESLGDGDIRLNLSGTEGDGQADCRRYSAPDGRT